MSPRYVVTAFLVVPVLMTASIVLWVPKDPTARLGRMNKSRELSGAAAFGSPGHSMATGQPAPTTPTAAKSVRPETLKQGYIIRVKDLTGLASPSSPIYLAHSHNGWDPGSEKFKLQPRSDMSWEIVMTPAAADSAMEFKFTRGSWEYEELKEDLSVPANRMLPDVDAKYVGSEEKPEFVISIPKWGDQRPNVQARADVNPYYYLSTTGTVRRVEVIGGVATPFKRDVLVWLPPGYDDAANKDRRYPVLYMHDGQNLFQKHPGIPAEWGADETASALINQGVIEPLIIVGIPHANKMRTVEYLPPVADIKVVDDHRPGGDAYLDWVIGSVMPRVDRVFRTRKGPADTAIGGASLGGLISLYAGARNPEVFGKVLAESPSMRFQGQDLWKPSFERSGAFGGKVFLAVGGQEAGAADQSAAYSTAVKAFGGGLSSKGLGTDRLRFVFDESAKHSEEAWAKRLPEALKFLFPAR